MVKYNSYRLGFKLKVINYKESHNISQAAVKYNIDRKLVRSWSNNKVKILAQYGKSERRRCLTHREGRFPELEEQLHTWVNDERRDGRLVSGENVQTKARELNTHGQDFQASNGWLYRFLKRKRLQAVRYQ